MAKPVTPSTALELAQQYAALQAWACTNARTKEDAYTLMRCTAWVLNRGAGLYTIDDAKAAALSIIATIPIG